MQVKAKVSVFVGLVVVLLGLIFFEVFSKDDEIVKKEDKQERQKTNTLSDKKFFSGEIKDTAKGKAY